MPPQLVATKPVATAVAFAMCGAELLGTQVDVAGAKVYTPLICKNNEPYLTFELSLP